MLQISQRPLCGSELDQKLFVGRSAELTRLEQAMDLGFNVLLLGERGIGVTSLIHQCSALIHDETPPPFRCHIVDGGRAHEIEELVTAIREVLRSGKSLSEQSIDQGLYSTRLYQGTYSDPFTELRELAYATYDQNLGYDPTIIVDNMNDPTLAHSLFGRQRDELWETPFKWIVCGRLSRRVEYLEPPADAFFDTEFILEPLDDSIARSLLEARINSTKPNDAENAEKIRSQIDEIVRRSDGNPRRLLNEARSVILQGKADTEKNKHTFDYANTLTAAEKLVLQYLQSHGPASASDVEMQSYIDVTRERLTQVLRQLENYGVVFSFLDKSGAGRPRKYYSLRSSFNNQTGLA